MRNFVSKVSDKHDCNAFCTCSGNKYHILYSSKIEPDGSITLTESNREDIQRGINSYKDSCDMNVIIAKLRCGDTSPLTKRKPMYGDFTVFPTSYAEMIDMVHRSEEAFECLDPSIKQQFDNDRNKWFASIGSPRWLEAMGFNVGNSVSVDSNESEVD